MTEHDLDIPTWCDFVGQMSIKNILGIHISAAVAEERPLDHVLLMAPPGCGKTTLAHIISSQLGDPMETLVMPVRPDVLANTLRRFRGGVLFLDEIHRAPKSLQEDLLPLLDPMTRYFQTPGASRIHIPWLTVVGATTEPEKVTPALYLRFPIRPDFQPYSPEDMLEIAELMAEQKGLTDEVIIQTIANAAGGCPRTAKNLVFGAHALKVTGQRLDADALLRLCQVDNTGLNTTQLNYLSILRQLDGRAGLELVATMLRLHPSVVRDTERLLVDRGLITYEERGRQLTDKGWNHGQPVQKVARVHSMSR